MPIIFIAVLILFQRSILCVSIQKNFGVRVLIWENLDLCLGQKYTLMSRLGGRGLRFRSRFVEFSFR